MKRAKQRRRQLPYPRVRYSYCKVSGDGAPAWYDPLFSHIILPTNQGPASPPVQPHLGIKQYIILPTNQRPASPPVQPHLWIKQYIFLPTNQRPASQPAVQPHLGVIQYIILLTNQRPASPSVQPHLGGSYSTFQAEG